MTRTEVPDIIVGRLPRYLQILQRLHQDGIHNTSSLELSKKTGFTAAQIRKDLSQFGEFGKQGTGYSVSFLIQQLQNILKVDRVWDIIIVGAGDLGHAIARYQGFTNRGFRIVSVWDNNPSKIGTTIGMFTVQDIASLPAAMRANQIEIAMLTVPASAAQPVAEELVKAGIKAILSYAPIPLSLPPEVRVEYIDPIIQLQHMTYYVE